MNCFEIKGGGNNYLSLPNTNCIKGIFALFVLIHHLYQHSGLFHGTYIGGVFQGLGYVSVAMFFFLSGYGLHISYKTKGVGYVKAMPRNRILPMYIQCLILVGIYTVFNLILKKEITLGMLFKSVTWGGTIIANGWYLQAILVLYTLYYLVYGLANKMTADSRWMYLAMFTLLVVYALINVLLGKSITYYQSIFAFFLGIFWCENKSKIDEMLQKNWSASVAVSFLSFAMLFIAGIKISPVKILSAVAFVVFALIVLMKIPVYCSVTRWLGKYYFEIYVMQGIALLLFHSDIVYIEKRWLYVIMCILVTLILSIGIHPVFAWTSRAVKGKGLRKNIESMIK